MSNILAGMGDLSKLKGDLASAVSYYQQAINIARQRNDSPKLASHLLSFGRAMWAVGTNEAARKSFEESLTTARECWFVNAIGGSLYSIACLEYSQNQLESAKSHAHQALDLFRRLGMKREQAEAEALLARLGDGTAETLKA